MKNSYSNMHLQQQNGRRRRKMGIVQHQPLNLHVVVENQRFGDQTEGSQSRVRVSRVEVITPPAQNQWTISKKNYGIKRMENQWTLSKSYGIKRMESKKQCRLFMRNKCFYRSKMADFILILSWSISGVERFLWS